MHVVILHTNTKQSRTYRLGTCDFARKCSAKISRRKFLDNLKNYRVVFM